TCRSSGRGDLAAGDRPSGRFPARLQRRKMADFLILVSQEIWHVLKEASIFLLFGFALAGALAVLMPAGFGRPLAVR
ncbi:MAG: hypothetical protein ACREIR_10025, partial [Geminicoccaceae bacterium]